MKRQFAAFREWLGLKPDDPLAPYTPMRPPRWRDLILCLVPAVLWYVGVHSRDVLIPHHCLDHPERCTVELIAPMDRISVDRNLEFSDRMSFRTQNLSGLIAIGGTLVLHLLLAYLGRRSTRRWHAQYLFEDLAILAQTIFWNGFFTELSHTLSARPRPFMYSHMEELAKDSDHYTSFYSGHTSFSGAAMTAFFLILLRRRAPLPLLVLAAITAQSLMMMTGIFRVFAGRHFITDVVAGGIAGALVALVVALRYRKTHALE